MISVQYDQNTLTEIARRLSDVQRRMLQALKDRGPGMLLEVAVRVLKFPEDVAESLKELQTMGLVRTQAVSGGQFGGDLFSLTSAGEDVLRLLNDPTFQLAVAATAPAAAPAGQPPDPRRQEAELLKKLGDLSQEKGDLEKAVEYYQQALSITRDLTAGGGST